MHKEDFLDLIGFNRQKINIREPLISTIGGFLGIFCIIMASIWLLDPEVSVLIIPSMGASAVLLFAAPHVPFSQPWNVFGGHAFSGVIGVACWQLIPDYTIAASASVGLSIGVMYLARCIHPPGGATALAAVIGSEKLHNLGFNYEFEPVILNTITILVVAIIFNGFFKWRRYPDHLSSRVQTLTPPITQTPTDAYEPISHEEFVAALSQIDTYVDISEDDLVRIYSIATRKQV